MADEKTSNQPKSTDSLTPAAGKVILVGDRAKDCLQQVPGPTTPPVVRKFRNSIQPGPGAIRVHHGKANDPDVAADLVHGINTTSSNAARTISFKPHLYQGLLKEKMEELSEATYASKHKAPLGRSHDQQAGLPSWYDDNTTFGFKTLKDFSASELVNPQKTAKELESETLEGHQAYIRSHQDYFAGERVDRNYDTSSFNKDIRCGIPTPHFADGRNLAKNLKWQGETEKFYDPNPAWKRTDGSKEKMEEQFGNIIKMKRNPVTFPADHTFGIPFPKHRIGVGEIFQSSEPSRFSREQERQRGLVHALRHHIKKVNFHNFPSVLQAFKHYDKKGRGVLDREDILEVCRQLDLHVNEPIMNDLMDYCDTDKDGFISFLEFANFLNWKDKMPLNSMEQRTIISESQGQTADADTETKPSSPSAQPPTTKVLINEDDLEPREPDNLLRTVRRLRRPGPVPGQFSTSPTPDEDLLTLSQAKDGRTFGVPSVRSDLPPPRTRRVTDTTNYGDIANIADILHPSVYALRGVHEHHFFCPRTKEEITEIFRNVGVSMSEETFEEAWKLASMRHPTGRVCVEIFRDVLKEIKAM